MDRNHHIYQANHWITSDHDFLELIQQNNATVLVSPSSSSRIPKFAHFIWLGEKPLPTFAQPCIQSFLKHHPGWEYKIWTDNDLPSLSEALNKDLIASPHFNFGLKSDLLRYELLRRYGGFYLDIDYEFLQSCDLILRSSSFFCGLSNTLTCEVNNGVIGCTPNHPLMEKINLSVRERLLAFQAKEIAPLLPNELIMSFLSEPERNQIHQVIQGKLNRQTIALTGPGMLTSLLFQFLSNQTPQQRELNRVLILPVEVFSIVPNKSMVSLSRLSCPALLGTSSSPDIDAISEEEWRQRLLNYDYLLYIQSKLSASSSSGFDEMNWRDYEEVKNYCVNLSTNSSLVTAIHWWQRSWQV